MTRTSMPGFTAETSLCNKAKPYMASVFNPQTDAEYVQPALSNACETLNGLLWRAYVNKSYAAAQYFYDAMEGAGCFK
jgi:hypothetical protein